MHLRYCRLLEKGLRCALVCSLLVAQILVEWGCGSQQRLGGWCHDTVGPTLSLSAFSSHRFYMDLFSCPRSLGQQPCKRGPLLLLLFLKFIYFWLHWVVVAARGLSLVVASGGATFR